VVPRGELDKLEGPKYAARRAEFAERREKPREQGIGRRRRRRRMWMKQRRATRPRMKRQEREKPTTRVGRPRGVAYKVAARIGARDCEER